MFRSSSCKDVAVWKRKAERSVGVMVASCLVHPFQMWMQGKLKQSRNGGRQ